jgi:hypothetical protein
MFGGVLVAKTASAVSASPRHHRLLLPLLPGDSEASAAYRSTCCFARRCLKRSTAVERCLLVNQGIVNHGAVRAACEHLDVAVRQRHKHIDTVVDFLLDCFLLEQGSLANLIYFSNSLL